MPNDQPTNGRDSMQARIKSKYFGSLQIPQLMPCSENTYENTISCIWYRNTFEIGINFFSARGPCGSCPRRPLSRRRLRLLAPRQWLPVPCGGCPRRPLSRRRLLLLGPSQWLPVPCGGCPYRPLDQVQDGYDSVGYSFYDCFSSAFEFDF